MPASKRKAEESKSTTRASKAAKTGEQKGKSKPTMSATAFKSKAKALHVALTQDEGGSVGELNLVPTSFSTGSYGWKGSKKITVQLEESESGEPTNVQVMVSINATIIGSKGGKNIEVTEETEEITESKEKEQGKEQEQE